METPGTYYRGTRITIVELNGKYAWIRFPDSDNSRKVLISDLMIVN